jgi:hypothetical protein
MRSQITILITLLLSEPFSLPAVTSQSIGKRYVKHTFTPSSEVRSVAGAGIQQARNNPREWGGGFSGFGKRLASGFGEHVVKGTIEFGVATVRHEELGYRPSNRQGFGPRLKYALASTVVTHKTTTGKPTFASGRVSGAFGSGFISRSWMPARFHTVASGAATGGILLGVDAGTHVAKEFWPEIRHPRAHNK